MAKVASSGAAGLRRSSRIRDTLQAATRQVVATPPEAKKARSSRAKAKAPRVTKSPKTIPRIKKTTSTAKSATKKATAALKAKAAPAKPTAQKVNKAPAKKTAAKKAPIKTAQGNASNAAGHVGARPNDKVVKKGGVQKKTDTPSRAGTPSKSPARDNPAKSPSRSLAKGNSPSKSQSPVKSKTPGRESSVLETVERTASNMISNAQQIGNAITKSLPAMPRLTPAPNTGRVKSTSPARWSASPGKALR